MKVRFRDARDAEDVKFALETFLENQRTSYSAGLVPIEDWFDIMRPIYAGLMQREGMRTVIAYEQTDPDFVYGCIIADPTEQAIPGKEGNSFRYWPALVLFVFVKANYRRQGVARGLFDAVGIDTRRPFLYASNSVLASRLASTVPRARFNPLSVRFPKEKRAA